MKQTQDLGVSGSPNSHPPYYLERQKRPKEAGEKEKDPLFLPHVGSLALNQPLQIEGGERTHISLPVQFELSAVTQAGNFHYGNEIILEIISVRVRFVIP